MNLFNKKKKILNSVIVIFQLKQNKKKICSTHIFTTYFKNSIKNKFHFLTNFFKFFFSFYCCSCKLKTRLEKEKTVSEKLEIL